MRSLFIVLALIIFLLLLLVNRTDEAVHFDLRHHHEGTAAAPLPVILDEKLRNMTNIAMELSMIAYFDRPENRLGFEQFQVFRDGSTDQAIFARSAVTDDNARCFVAFRGTNLWSISDVLQYMSFFEGTRDVYCPKEQQEEDTTTTTATTTGCCKTRAGFWKAYHAKYRDSLETVVDDCVRKCHDKDDCLVLTGHSGGGIGLGLVIFKVMHDEVSRLPKHLILIPG